MKTYIIDDDQISIFLTKHCLTEAGFPGDFLSFLSAEKALNTILEEMPTAIPQVILLDLNMPGMSGWEFLDELVPFNPQLLGRCHIYILTSSLDISDTAKSKEYELVKGLIHKVIKLEDVQTILYQLSE